jgi:hypothetical protein
MNIFSGITTQYKSPTDTKGTRIIASYIGKEKYIHFWDYGINTTDNHYQAAQGLRVKLGWLSDIESGCIIKTGYAWAVNRL